MIDDVIDQRTAIAVTPAAEISAGPLQMAMQAMKAGMSVADMRSLLELQKDYEANEARKAYVSAVATFKLNSPAVYKDKENAQYRSKYTSIGNLVNTVNSALSAHGLSAHWTIDQTDKIKVTCILTHRLGHSDSCSMSGPADTSGAKNPLQQIKSTVTYLKLATYEAITGIASSEGNEDDDGNGSGSSKDTGNVETIDVQPFINEVRATRTDSDAAACWKVHNGKFVKQPHDHELFKQAVIDHRMSMKKPPVMDVNTLNQGEPF